MTKFARALGMAGVFVAVQAGCVGATRETQRSGAEPPTEVALCSLVEKPALFDGMVVEVVAEAVTDMHDFVVLLDSKCPGKGVALQFPGEPPENKDLEAFRDALFAMSNKQHTLLARFVGTYESHPGEVPSRVLVYRSHRELPRPTETRGAPKE